MIMLMIMNKMKKIGRKKIKLKKFWKIFDSKFSKFQKNFFQKIFQKNSPRHIYTAGYKLMRFTPKGSAPVVWIVRQFWIFLQFTFLNFLTIAYSYIVYSRYPDFSKSVNHFQNFQNFPFPDFSRTIVRAGKTWKTNGRLLGCSSKSYPQVRPNCIQFSRCALWKTQLPKSDNRFHAVKRNTARSSLFKSALLYHKIM